MRNYLVQLERLRNTFPELSFRKSFYVIFSDYPSAGLLDRLLAYKMSDALRSEMLAMKMELSE